MVSCAATPILAYRAASLLVAAADATVASLLDGMRKRHFGEEDDVLRVLRCSG